MVIVLFVVGINQNIGIADSLLLADQYRAAESLYVLLLGSPVPEDVAYANKGLGNIRMSYGDIDSAVALYQNALVIFRKHKDLRGEVKILNNLSAAATLTGEHVRALDLALEGIEKSRKISAPSNDDKKDLVALFNNAGQSCEMTGEIDRAFEYLNNAIAASESIGHKIGAAEAGYSLAVLLRNTGQIKAALNQYMKAREDHIGAGSKRGAADCLREMGSIQRRLGNYQQALSDYLSALTVFEELGSGSLYGHVEIINDLGLLSLEMNHYSKAKEYFQRAYEIYVTEMNVDIDGIATVMINLGLVHGRLALAEPAYYDSAFYFFDIAQKYTKQKSTRAELFYSTGLIYEQRGDYKNAVSMFNQACKNYELTNDKINLARIKNDIANLMVLQQEPEPAIVLYREALSAIESAGFTAWKALLCVNLGITLKRTGDIDGALLILEQAVDLVENIRGQITSQEYRSTYFTDKDILYEEIIDLYFKKGDVGKAFDHAERAKARALLDLIGQVDFSGSDGIAFETRAMIAREQEKQLLIDYLTGDPQQAQAIIEHNDIMSRLALQFPEYSALKTANPVTIGELQEELDDSTALIEFFLGPQYGFAFVITDKGIAGRKLKGTVGEIYGLTDSLVRLVKKRASFEETAQYIFEQLIGTGYTEIAQKKRIGIIPHGRLHHLPFALLYDPVKQRTLIQDHDLFYVPSASVYCIAHRRNTIKKSKAAVFAKSEFREHPDWNDLPLPGTNGEKDSLIARGVFKSVEVFSDLDSMTRPPTEENAKKYMKLFDIIHLATHGKLDPDSPLDSRIMLSTGSAEDGVLKTREIFNLDLDAYLVTLSACETGKLRGYDGSYAGDELTGLTRAFIYAGAASVIASLWKVHDQATALLMTQFYINLRQHDKTHALNEAQRWMMTNDDLYYFNPPYYWAAFAVFGDWQ